ncbi:MAG: hypothetical protein ACE5HQ_00165 [Gemmatimonadota bacterium]
MSDPRKRDPAEPGGIEEALHRLEDLTGRLLRELAAARQRAAEAESTRSELEEALQSAGRRSMDPAEFEKRLEALVAENERLRGLLEEARRRAGRIRRQLMVVEDEL